MSTHSRSKIITFGNVYDKKNHSSHGILTFQLLASAKSVKFIFLKKLHLNWNKDLPKSNIIMKTKKEMEV